MNHRNPAPTVDIIIELINKPSRPIVLIERKNEPFGWAIPGGFVDYGESIESSAIREAKEEVSLDIELIEQFYVYSDPNRDPRQHTLAIVFIATAKDEPVAADDAKNIGVFNQWDLPQNLCFDHDRIMQDYWSYRNYGLKPNIN